MSAQNPPRKRKKKKKKGGGAQGRASVQPVVSAHEPWSSRPWWLAALLAAGLLGVTAWAWPPRPAPEPHVRRGNELYGQREYREALGQYESAPGSGPRNAGTQLDRGLARYRIAVPGVDGGLAMLPPDASAPEGYNQAQEELRTAARGGTTATDEDVDTGLRARAAYDLANTFFTQHHWDNAIDAYKEALRLRPSWHDAAWNLELARRLRELERNPPDAGQDASADAVPPDAQDSGSDAQDSGTPDGGPDAGGDSGGADGGGDGGAGDSGGGEGGTGDSGNGDGGTQDRDGGSDNHADAGPSDAAPPRSMAPLDDLDRTSHSLQNEMMRRRGVVPRNPDDDR